MRCCQAFGVKGAEKVYKSLELGFSLWTTSRLILDPNGRVGTQWNESQAPKSYPFGSRTKAGDVL